MTSSRRLSALIAPAVLASSLAIPAAHAVTIEFNTAAEYTGNFTEVSNPTTIGYNGTDLAVSQSASSSFSTAAFNTPVATSGDFDLSFDGKFSGGLGSLGASSVGFYTNLSGSTGTSTGYLVIFRITTGTQADVRIYEGANLSSNNLGTPVTRTVTVSNGTFATNTYYNFFLSVERSSTPGSSLTFSASILNATNDNVIASFTDYTDASPTNFNSGLVGIRLGSTGGTPSNTVTTIDNFTTSAIPEPSAFAAFGGLAALGFAAMRRRRA